MERVMRHPALVAGSGSAMLCSLRSARKAGMTIIVWFVLLFVAPAHALELQDGLPAPYAAPEIAGVDGWINSEPQTIAALRGKVVLVDFWTYSCINCIRTLKHINAWNEKYREQGLVILGVHSPEFEFEKERANVQKAVTKWGIQYPVALDNHMATWTNFSNRYWPAHYLINKEGQVVYTHFGEGKYDVTENNIRYLLGLSDAASAIEKEKGVVSGQTPETYLGYARAKNFTGEIQEGVAEYALPEKLSSNHWALSGTWKIEAERITSQSANASLQLRFTAKKVFLVLGTATGKPISVTLKLNGQPAGKVMVDSHNLYPLIEQEKAQSGLLEIISSGDSLELYAFTFG
ncbi:MAG: thioredoxin family protein [Alphaproteobacteria bacterium]|nr:thioredoxin family protein [Alphaproteobacteria bacterium]